MNFALTAEISNEKSTCFQIPKSGKNGQYKKTASHGRIKETAIGGFCYL